MSMNRVTLLGNLGSDPELKETKEGKSLVSTNSTTPAQLKENIEVAGLL